MSVLTDDGTDCPPAYVLGEARLLAARPPTPERRTRSWLTQAAEQVGLRGRGGAAFPVSRKLDSVARGAHVLVNGSEGEPASWKDRALMRRSPQLVIDGARVVADALHSRHVSIAVTDAASAHALEQVVADRRLRNRFQIVRANHGFVGGEIGALVNGLNGFAPVPSGRRVLPSKRGIAGRSTYASNVETFAQIALLAALGPEEYASHGTAAEPGTSLLTVHTGARHMVLEVPHGAGLPAVIGPHTGPVLIGGYHGAWVDGTSDLTIDRTALAAAGIGLGAGVLATLPEDTCSLGEVARVAHWLARQSTGQCGPCTFGLPSIADDLHLLATHGRHPSHDHVGGVLERLQRRLGVVTGRGACAHPTASTRFVASWLATHRREVERHLGGGCHRSVLGVLPVGRPR